MSRRSTDGPQRIVIPFHPARKSEKAAEQVASKVPTADGTERRETQRRNDGSGASRPPLSPLVETWIKQHKKGPALSSGHVAANLARLTDEEQRANDRAVDFYRYVGKPGSEALSLAWTDVQLAFPRLQQYDAAQPSDKSAAE